jgi:predicted ArsR family transcriptional regulator
MNTRDQILEYLRQHPGTTVRELSEVLQVTPADVRHHLKSLDSDKLVQRISTDLSQTRGRPAQGFSLSANQASVAMNHMLFSILSESLSGIESQARRDFLERICNRLVGDGSTAKSMAQKLVYAVKKLTDLGFTARWEARAESPQIIVEGFPFIIEAASRDIYLQLTEILLERMLGTQVKYHSDERGKHPSETIYRFSIGTKPSISLSK